jgi:type I restriction enzyme S subunit
VVTVADVTQEHKQGYYTKEKYSNKGTKLVRVTDLQNPSVVFKGMPYLEISDKDFNDFKIELDDFIFARSGAIGRYGIVENIEYPAIFGSYLIRFKFNNKIINRLFGYYYESEVCSKQLKAISQGNANININAENIKSLKIPLPPLSEQKKIAAILSKVDEKLSVLDAQRAEYGILKKGMMQVLLTGEVRVN